MKTIELLAVGVRLVGLYLLVLTIKYVGSAYFSYHQMAISMPDFNPLVISGGYVVSALLMFIFSILFIKFPATIAYRLLPKADKDSPKLSEDSSQIQLAGFTLLGIYILSWAIPDLIYNLAVLSVIPFYDSSYSMGNRPYDLVNLGVTIIEIIIGLYLVFQAKGLVKLIDRIRYAGP
jgi:hypothetical protein